MEKALRPWAYAKDLNPKLQSITSRLSGGLSGRGQLLEGSDNLEAVGTSFVVYKAYSIFNSLNLLHHYYLVIDGKVWHPGYVDDLRIFHDHDNEVNSTVKKIEESCHNCLYHDMKKKFQNDRAFNIITNNCQRITGQITETTLTVAYHILLVIALLTGSLSMLVMAILIFTSIFIFNSLNTNKRELEMYYCPHIRLV